MRLEDSIPQDADKVVTIYSSKDGTHVDEDSPDIYRMDVSYFKDGEEIFRYWAFADNADNMDELADP